MQAFSFINTFHNVREFELKILREFINIVTVELKSLNLGLPGTTKNNSKYNSYQLEEIDSGTLNFKRSTSISF